MSTTLSMLDRHAAGRSLPTPSRRLWTPLSRHARREQPVTGVDVAGEFLRGRLARMRSLRRLRRRAARILDRGDPLRELSEHDFSLTIDSTREAVMLARHDDAVVDQAFAVAREAVRREIGLELYPEQVMGALAMSHGFLAEMATGEGKTVTAILPAALDGWSGRGVHVVTVNDYLARRDAATTAPAYRRLGLTVAAIQDADDGRARQKAYASSITYGADKQIIFDFLRDRLLSPLNPRLAAHVLDQVEQVGGARGDAWNDRIVQRGLHAAIIDEADSILIDEATTPAIIAADIGEDEEERLAYFRTARDIAAGLVAGTDYTVDSRVRRVLITETGERAIAGYAKNLPPFWSGPRRRRELVTQALNAAELYQRGDDYIVRNGEVVIVDPSTGRILEGRQWQLGLHQAVEVKEDLEVSATRRTSARISYQRLFGLYERRSGMTGTAAEVADELWRYYHLPVVRVPTHRPLIRRHPADRVFLNEDSKFEAVANRVQELHDREQPVLIGTRSVTASERMGEILGARGINARILNAMRESEEAEIVADAGQPGAVTVATNMAGRGTDITLTSKTRELGGLVVIGTERHGEARVDRQLAGRAGRQGDPGRAEFFVSLEDDLIKVHAARGFVALVRLSGGIVRRRCAAAVWKTTQWSAARKAATTRAETARSEAWLDMALHHHTR